MFLLLGFFGFLTAAFFMPNVFTYGGFIFFCFLVFMWGEHEKYVEEEKEKNKVWKDI